MTTITLDYATTVETPLQYELSSGTALHLDISRAQPRPEQDARVIAAAFAHAHELPAATADDLIQIVDALVANAIGHAHWTDEYTPVGLTLTRLGQAVIVEVSDPDTTCMPVWPTPGDFEDAAIAFLDDPDTDPDAPVLTRGRGLLDVAARAETVTAFVEEPGKVVRAILAVPERSER